MKLNRKQLRRLISEAADSETGAFYRSKAGAMFGNSNFGGDPRFTGIQALMFALEEARDPILRIQSVAEDCRAVAAGGEDSFALDPENYEYFDNMVKICDELLERMQYEVLMQF